MFSLIVYLSFFVYILMISFVECIGSSITEVKRYVDGREYENIKFNKK